MGGLRQIFAILNEPLKQELGLADQQLGFLSGFAFVMFFTTLGIPAPALTLFAVPGILLGLFIGPTFAQVQWLVKPRMRALAASLLLFSANLFGPGHGPQVGALSDAPSTG